MTAAENECFEGVQKGSEVSRFGCLLVHQTPGNSGVYGKGRFHMPTILMCTRPHAIFLSIYNIKYFIR